MEVELQRGPDLLLQPVLHDHDAVAHGHGLDLVMGDVDDGGLEPIMEFFQLHPHLHPQLGIQVGEGLVEEEDLGLAHDGPAYGDPLALPAGKGFGLAVQELLDVQDFRRVLDPLVDLGLGKLPQGETESHVLINGHVGVKGVVLEDHGNVPVFGGKVVDHLVVDEDIPGGDVLEAGHHAQGGRLAATAGADQDHELFVRDLQVEIPHRLDLAEMLVQLLHQHLGHILTPLVRRSCRRHGVSKERVYQSRRDEPEVAREGADSNE